MSKRPRPQDAPSPPLTDLNYYYISPPYASQLDRGSPFGPTNSRQFPLFVDNPKHPLLIEKPHIPYIQPSEQRVVLASWMMQTVTYYGLARLLEKVPDHPHAEIVKVLDSYRHNSFDEFNDYFAKNILRHQGRIDLFKPSFGTIGCPMPRQGDWTLFTGEGQYGTELMNLCLTSRNTGVPVKVPMQLSTTWNFNVALSFMGEIAGCVVALHYKSSPDVDFQVMAHLLQELASYNNYLAKPYECEILLQPGLTIRFLHEETVPKGLHKRSIASPGPSRFPSEIREFNILHVEIVGSETPLGDV
jgi:hypothetical protein